MTTYDWYLAIGAGAGWLIWFILAVMIVKANKKKQPKHDPYIEV